jgi:GAF domain-containing protein
VAAQSFEAADAFSELGRIKLSETDLKGILQKVADLAKGTVAGATEVSVTLIDAGAGPHTAAFTGDLALTLDEWQYAGGGGPCLQAAASQTTVLVPDLDGEQRWPAYLHRAIDAGVRSSLSVGLPVHETVTGALNIYSTESAAFDRNAVLTAQAFSGYAAVALANAHLYHATATLAQQMQEAMEHRAVIEQAKGMIIAARGCSAEEAFAILSKLSQNSNRKLRDIAAAMVRRGQQHSDRSAGAS